MSATMSDSIRNTRFEYWLLNPEGQIGTFFFTIMLVALIWLIVLQYSTRQIVMAAGGGCGCGSGGVDGADSPATTGGQKEDNTSKHDAHDNDNNDENPTDDDDASSISSLDSLCTSPPGRAPNNSKSASIIPQGDIVHPSSHPSDASAMSRLVPPGHQPVNADLKVSPFSVIDHFVEPTSFSMPGAPAPQNRQVRATSREGSSEEEGLAGARDFSSLAKDAPWSYETLRERGLVGEDGTPSKKWVGRERLRELGV